MYLLTNLDKTKGVNKSNIYWQRGKVQREDRERLNGHRAGLIWFTGLPGAGKSTLSKELEYKLHQKGIKTYLLDGDNIRHGLCKDLGFSKEDRKENLRRIGEVAKLFVDAGIVTIAAFASPFAEDRNLVRSLFKKEEFIEVYVKCSLEVCMQRDPKGLYKRAKQGEINNLTGFNAPYEEPENPEIIVETDKKDIESCILKILSYLEKSKIIKPVV
ncbi:MAG: adenylylsulfate kinase [Desulfonauticus sp.]|jgi:adenylylsulfate kinase|nr:adenylylsulfate kinase [Desulfonauticus sp.]